MIEYRLFGLWRFLAALLVMAYHFAHYHSNARAVVLWFENMSPLLDMFFVLSGFLIFNRYGWSSMNGGDYVRFLARRIARLYPLHLLTLSFFIVVGLAVNAGWISSGGGTARYDFAALPANLLLLQAWGVTDTLTFNYVSWSLSAEWFAYLCFPLLLIAFRKAGIAGLALLLIVVVVLLEFADHGVTSVYDTWYEAKEWGAYRVLADFTYGAIIAVLARRFPLGISGLAPAWTVMAIAILGMFAGIGFYPALILIGVAIYLGATGEAANPAASAWMKPLMPLAAVSFGIYLWHPVVETLLISVVWRRWLEATGMVPFEVFVILPFIASILVALLSARFLEAPAARFLDKRFKAMLGTPAPRNAPAE